VNTLGAWFGRIDSGAVVLSCACTLQTAVLCDIVRLMKGAIEDA
jgi:hypothetical protein